MRIVKHTIKGASLQRIEELDHLGTPDWVPYTRAVGQMTAVEEAMAETQHYSGLLRSIANMVGEDLGEKDPFRFFRDEDGGKHDIEEILDDAAERLDQAHEDWLEQMKHSVRHQEPLLNDQEAQQLQMILMTYCEDCDSDEETGREVDALWAKIKEAKQ